MPTERFERLSEKKKRIIYRAAVQELCRGSGDDLNVSRIADAAQISRSSFYTYFAGKEDVYRMLFRQSWQWILNVNQRELLECGGDFWKMQEEVLPQHMQAGKKDYVCRLVYQSAEHTILPDFRQLQRTKQEEYQRHKTWVYRHLDRKSRIWWKESEFDILQDICWSLLFAAVQGCLQGSRNEHETNEHFRREILQLKRFYQNRLSES